MQKLEFVKNLEFIVLELKSDEIVNLFEKGYGTGGNAQYDYGIINPYLFLSKSGYDQMIKFSDYREILTTLLADSIYSEANLARLTSILKLSLTVHISGNPIVIQFFSFHKALLNTMQLSKQMLLSRFVNDDFAASLEKGVILFQIIIEQEGLETEKYIKILTALEELIETIAKIVQEEEQKSELILLDSGSDTNLGVKAGVETAKSLFLIFKEAWDFIVNRKFYNQKQLNKALLESLSVRTQIKEKVDSGVITAEEGQGYSHIIKSRTDELIGMKVLPKELAGQTTVISNKNLISEYQEFKRLGTGE